MPVILDSRCLLWPREPGQSRGGNQRVAPPPSAIRVATKTNFRIWDSKCSWSVSQAGGGGPGPENTNRGHIEAAWHACLLTDHHNPCRLDIQGHPVPSRLGSRGSLCSLLSAGGLSPPHPLDAFGNSDFSPCVSTAAKSFMELGAGAEPVILPRARRLGHAAPSAHGAAAAGPPGLSREPREEEVPAVERDREPRRRADPVLWLCTAMPSIAW